MLHPLMAVWHIWAHALNVSYWNPYGAGAALVLAVSLIGYLVKSMIGRD
jgi:hypothetical protein